MTTLVEPRAKTAMIWGDERISYVQLLGQVSHWARHMEASGERVVIYAENSPSWVYCAYAVWAARSVLVPVDHLSTATELAYVLNDCRPALLVCSRHGHAAVIAAVELTEHRPRVVVIEELEALAVGAGEEDRGGVVVDEAALAAIVYTSGTTGQPKGVMLSFANLMTNVRAVVEGGYFTPQARVLLLLPLHHVLPLAGSLMAPLFGGSTIVFATSLAADKLVPLFQTHAITTIVGVPRFYDLLHRTLQDRIHASAAGRGLYALARAVRSRAFSRLVFASVHRKFGGELKHLVCGGAALSPDTAETFDVLGFHMCEGFGMTECAPMITFPRLRDIRLGSCGQVLDGCEVKIDANGEILARGPNVMLGYYGRNEDTHEILRDGWLHTGDLGRLDEDGYLYVTGRLKEILVLGSGKKVNPAVIESSLEAASPAVREVGVFLDGDVLHAVLVPNRDVLPRLDRNAQDAWFRSHAIDPYNATVAPYRQVVKITVTDEALPRTRLSKLRRHLLVAFAARHNDGAMDSNLSEASADGAAARLLAFVERHCGRRVPVTSRLQADLGLDSLGRVELSVFIERVFGVAIAESRLAEIDTIADLAGLLAQQQIDDEAVPQEVSWASILKPRSGVVLPRTSLYHLGIIYSSRLLVRGLFSVKIRGRVELPSGPFIVVPNHQSYIDGLFVCAYLHPRVVQSIMFYAKAQHVQSKIVKFLAKRGNTVVMNPQEGYQGSLQQLAAGLRRGNRLMIFPEGTRSRDGALGPFKDAYAILSRELSVPVVPVVIDGADAVLPRGGRIPKFSRRVNLTYLDPLSCREGESAADFNGRVRAVIESELALSRAERVAQRSAP